MRADLVSSLEPLIDQLRCWRDSVVVVVEEITRSPGTLDRHFATRTVMVMRLRDVGVQLSGARLWVSGLASGLDVEYQVAVELLDRLSIGPGEVVVVERIGPSAERHSTIRPRGELSSG